MPIEQEVGRKGKRLPGTGESWKERFGSVDGTQPIYCLHMVDTRWVNKAISGGPLTLWRCLSLLMHRIVNILCFVGCGGFCGNYSVCCRDEKAAVDHAQANAQLVLSNTVCKKQQGSAGKGQNLLALVDISSSKISYDLHAEEKYLEFPCGWSMLKVAQTSFSRV